MVQGSNMLLVSAALVGSALASPSANGFKPVAGGFVKPAPPSTYATSGLHRRQEPLNIRQDGNVCATDRCKSFADSVIAGRALNYTNVDPCTNFAEYTCGNWWATHDFRDDQSAIGVLSAMSDVNTALMRSILESPYPSNSTINSTYAIANATSLDEQNFNKMKAAYDSCMDTAAIDAIGAKPLQEILEAYESFASSGNSTSNGTDLTEKLIWVQRYGGSGLIEASTSPDDKEPDVTTVALGVGSLGLDAKEYYTDDEAIANYTAAITGMFDILYGQENHDAHVSLTSKIVTLEKALSAASPDSVDAGNVEYYYNPMTIAQADALIPEVSFARYVKAFAPSNYTVQNVIVLAPEYFPQVSNILKNTTTDAVNGYLEWVLIQRWATRLSDKVNGPYRRLQNELSGRAPEAVGERWRTCFRDVDTNLPWIESAFFVREAFSPEAKTFGERIINDVENVFQAKLKTYEWMSAEVKEKAIQKVLNMVEKIGYPDISPNIQDPKALADYYATLNVTADSWFENGLAYNNFSLQGTWNDLLHPTDKNRWFMTAPTVNAYFNPPTNEIAFPAGIMQQPLFNLDLPDYVSYGAFGAVAGHELTHAFDSSGSHYDETGAYRDWWDNSTLAAFNNKTKCFIEQYSKYSVTTPTGEKLNVNGDLTKGENVADVGGLAASFQAWQARNTETPNQLLPGLEEYTREQLFYLSFGGVWCGKTRPAEAVRRIYSDPHSPPSVRILGTVSDQRGFLEAFNCPVKEPVCELW
ncbi:peptidase family M13 [Byssothecium circinans]|uniref:Peptidase family M13 n=1 Tax=Byssothecium circinans TaxID=147558 RepID=A0A6A5U819_9PLEO|nr:peptidase family M13 [Byssothecium circinans]